MAGPKIAFCTLLDTDRAWLVSRLLPQWEAMDLAGGEVRWFAAVEDADDVARAQFRCRSTWPAYFVHTPNLADVVPDYPQGVAAAGAILDVEPFFFKMAMLREAVRQAAVAEQDDGWQPDHLFWLDSDVAPPGHGVATLLADLASVSGSLAPQCLSGIYPERNTGGSTPQYRGSGRLRVELRPDHIHGADFTGFGCVLMRRETAEVVTWAEYGAYQAEKDRLRRRITSSHHWDANAHLLAPVGEDVFWYRLCAAQYPVALLVDTRVSCRHYHRDGSYWEHYPAPDDRSMPTRYVRDEAERSRQMWVVNHGSAAHGIEQYGPHLLREERSIRPGEGMWVSPEIADSLCKALPGVFEATPWTEKDRVIKVEADFSGVIDGLQEIRQGVSQVEYLP